MVRYERILMAGVAFAAMACSDDLSGPRGDPMSRDEAMALAGGIVEVSEGAASAQARSGNQIPALSGDMAKGVFEFSREGSHACPSGGTLDFNVAVDAEFDKETKSARFDVAGFQKHAECAFPHQDVTITITGTPRLVFSASGEMAEGVPTSPFRFEAKGALDWTASDGRKGRCPIEVDAVIDESTRQKTMSALICGHTFTEANTAA